MTTFIAVIFDSGIESEGILCSLVSERYSFVNRHNVRMNEK